MEVTAAVRIGDIYLIMVMAAQVDQAAVLQDIATVIQDVAVRVQQVKATRAVVVQVNIMQAVAAAQVAQAAQDEIMEMHTAALVLKIVS